MLLLLFLFTTILGLSFDDCLIGLDDLNADDVCTHPETQENVGTVFGFDYGGEGCCYKKCRSGEDPEDEDFEVTFILLGEAQESEDGDEEEPPCELVKSMNKDMLKKIGDEVMGDIEDKMGDCAEGVSDDDLADMCQDLVDDAAYDYDEIYDICMEFSYGYYDAYDTGYDYGYDYSYGGYDYDYDYGGYDYSYCADYYDYGYGGYDYEY